VLNRTERFPEDEKDQSRLVDASKLSTPLLETLVTELDQIEQPESPAAAKR
jgi:hypothetical protein